MSNIYECRNLSKKYKSGETFLSALDNVDVDIVKGTITTILGPSGGGKTTLLNMLSGLDQVDKGKIIFEGQDIAFLNERKKGIYRRNNVGFIFQSYNLISTLTVKENVQLGKFLSKEPQEIDAIINELGLKNHMNKYPYQLSGGQQQRVAIARVLVKNPDVIFCDEPTGALDEKSGRKVLDLLQKVNEKYGTTLIMVTHNANIAQMSDKVIHFSNGKIIGIDNNETTKKANEIEWS